MLKFERISPRWTASRGQVIRGTSILRVARKGTGTLVATIDLEAALSAIAAPRLFAGLFLPSFSGLVEAGSHLSGLECHRDQVVENFILTNEEGGRWGRSILTEAPSGTNGPTRVVKGAGRPLDAWPREDRKTIQVQTRCDFECQKTEAVVSQNRMSSTTTPDGRVTVTNLPSGTYTTGHRDLFAEEVPVGIAKQLYDAVGILHYEGSLTLVGEEVPEIVGLGQLLNLTGARPEWASANCP